MQSENIKIFDFIYRVYRIMLNTYYLQGAAIQNVLKIIQKEKNTANIEKKEIYESIDKYYNNYWKEIEEKINKLKKIAEKKENKKDLDTFLFVLKDLNNTINKFENFFSHTFEFASHKIGQHRLIRILNNDILLRKGSEKVNEVLETLAEKYLNILKNNDKNKDKFLSFFEKTEAMRYYSVQNQKMHFILSPFYADHFNLGISLIAHEVYHIASENILKENNQNKTDSQIDFFLKNIKSLVSDLEIFVIQPFIETFNIEISLDDELEADLAALLLVGPAFVYSIFISLIKNQFLTFNDKLEMAEKYNDIYYQTSKAQLLRLFIFLKISKDIYKVENNEEKSLLNDMQEMYEIVKNILFEVYNEEDDKDIMRNHLNMIDRNTEKLSGTFVNNVKSLYRKDKYKKENKYRNFLNIGKKYNGECDGGKTKTLEYFIFGKNSENGDNNDLFESMYNLLPPVIIMEDLFEKEKKENQEEKNKEKESDRDSNLLILTPAMILYKILKIKDQEKKNEINHKEKEKKEEDEENKYYYFQNTGRIIRKMRLITQNVFINNRFEKLKSFLKNTDNQWESKIFVFKNYYYINDGKETNHNTNSQDVIGDYSEIVDIDNSTRRYLESREKFEENVVKKIFGSIEDEQETKPLSFVSFLFVDKIKSYKTSVEKSNSLKSSLKVLVKLNGGDEEKYEYYKNYVDTIKNIENNEEKLYYSLDIYKCLGKEDLMYDFKIENKNFFNNVDKILKIFRDITCLQYSKTYLILNNEEEGKSIENFSVRIKYILERNNESLLNILENLKNNIDNDSVKLISGDYDIQIELPIKEYIQNKDKIIHNMKEHCLFINKKLIINKWQKDKNGEKGQ